MRRPCCRPASSRLPTTATSSSAATTPPTNVREEIVRIDHNFTSKFSVFGHFIAEEVSQTHPTTPVERCQRSYRRRHFRQLLPIAASFIPLTHQPTLLNEVAFNYNGNHIDIHANAGLSNGPAAWTYRGLFPGPKT